VTTLREFKAKYMTKLMNLKKELLSKYHDKVDRVNYITDLLMSKLQTLRTYSLADYLHTIHLACREFEEFEVLIPDEKELDKLLKKEE